MKSSKQPIAGISPKAFQIFFKNQPVKKAFLFGSHARKEATTVSDIDLVVELDFDEIKTGMEFFLLWDNLEKLTGKKVDLITRDALSKYAIQDFERDKILLYERPEA